MDYLLLKDFLTTYSLPTLIVAIIVGIIGFIAEKFIVKKPSSAVSLGVFVLALILYVGYDMAFNYRAFVLTAQSLSAGLLSGSLSAVVKNTAKKISQGKPIPLSTTVLLIETIIEGYVDEKNLSATALSLDEVIRSGRDKKAQTVIDEVAKKLSVSGIQIPPTELSQFSEFIIKAVNSINDENNLGNG
jgi:hypothetical protein